MKSNHVSDCFLPIDSTLSSPAYKLQESLRRQMKFKFPQDAIPDAKLNFLCLNLNRLKFVRVPKQRLGWAYSMHTKVFCWSSEFTWRGRRDMWKFQPSTILNILVSVYTVQLSPALVWWFWQICYQSRWVLWGFVRKFCHGSFFQSFIGIKAVNKN